MAEEFLKSATRKEFLNYTTGFLETITSLLPESNELSQQKEAFARVSAEGDGPRLKETIESWLGFLKLPLHEKKVKYSKAIERITKAPASSMHALVYHDLDALRQQTDPQYEHIAKIVCAVSEESLADKDKEVLWSFVEKIASLAYEASGAEKPSIPTRAEIQDNIRRRKKESADDSQPSMQQAFCAHINSLAALWGKDNVLGSDEQVVKEWMKRWATFAHSETKGVKNSQLCLDGNAAVFKELSSAFPELEMPPQLDEKSKDDVWTHVRQINSFSTVISSVPVGMMTEIETMAKKLAEDISSGKSSMADLNLSELGQHVLSQCKEEDMDNFAENIDNLLPVLQQFQGLVRP